MQRGCGILYPVSSLPSRFGIGCFSKEAYEFADFLEAAGQGYWQILPIGPTGFGDSPYQPFSAFAGNPYFISPEKLIEEGLLTWDEVNGRDFGQDPERVDYGALYRNRYEVLQIAYERFKERGGQTTSAYQEFCEKESFWLEDYALYMAIKQQQDGKSWQDWDEPLKKRSKAALEKAREELADRIGFVCFQQFKFEQQWESLKAYINGKKIKVIGDLPFYMALDSADVWSHPEAFQMDKNLMPTAVAGCPPDAFSATGQLWGNPLYDWTKLKKSGYAWWMQRIRRNQEFYDVIRIDHFHGFAEYYAVPYGEESALKGTMKKGPGMDLFNALKEQMGEIPMIAEDLGTVTEENTKLLKDSGLPGMKVLQFAHDNTTSRAWIEEINDGERSYVRRYINSIYTDYGQFVWDFIREAYRSVADLCIIPIQDYLVKGKEARMNCPGVADGNWQWRVLPDFLSPELAESIRQLADVYQRMPS